MKLLPKIWVVIPLFVFILITLVSCLPATAAVPPNSETAPSVEVITSSETLQSEEMIVPSVTVSISGIAQHVKRIAPSATLQPLEILAPSATASVSETAQSVKRIAPSASLQSAEVIAPSATLCPQPTPELFWVEPVTSPTDQLSQTVHVRIGNGESVTVITESGTFTSTDNPSSVDVSLLPDTAHHLEVIAKVRTVVMGDGCTYGGSTLRTTRDRFGVPLTIVQGKSIPKTASEPITPENASRL